MYIEKKTIPSWAEIDQNKLKSLIEQANKEYNDFQQWIDYDDMRLFVEITKYGTKRGNRWSIVKIYLGSSQLV